MSFIREPEVMTINGILKVFNSVEERGVYFFPQAIVRVAEGTIDMHSKGGKSLVNFTFESLSEGDKLGTTTVLGLLDQWAELGYLSGESQGAEGNHTTVQVSASTSTEVLPASNTRTGFLITNRSGRNIYIAFGSEASTSNYSLRLGNNQLYESPSFAAKSSVHVRKQSGGDAPILITTF